ncbi:uncharacterized protein PFLUO_LOCUS8748 [Penicillium psychrofluorescens]|uniref:uncharacterized protein n=1 Tax=Penicillium psychrofluorescens TaxID=3158075 RepID=UPI003CCCB872
MSKPTTLPSRLAHLLKHWPVDNVRPASVSIQSYLQSRLDKPTALPDSSVNALSSLLDDRYARRYPLPPKLRHPASSPDHYDNLIREFDEAPNRDWFGRLRKRVGGILRLK